MYEKAMKRTKKNKKKRSKEKKNFFVLYLSLIESAATSAFCLYYDRNNSE